MTNCRTSISNLPGIACCCAGVMACCLSASAQDEPGKTPILVELFTSQNCPACPAANEKLIDLYETSEIFPLTFSVSYWDYLGWTDTFAKAEFNARQRAYADAFDLRAPYTPQAVVDGCLQTTGKVSTESIEQKIDMTRTPHGHEVDLNLTATGLELSALETIPAAEVWLVGFQPGVTAVVPNRGLNQNKMLSHVNMVTDLTPLGTWAGDDPIRLDFQCTSEACVVIVQESESKDVMAFVEVPGQASLERPAG